MSKENVVRRDPKNSRRKNTDGYRTDSGCFEDVDLQMANQHSPTSTSSETVIVENDDVTIGGNSEECRLMAENADASTIPPSLLDECADDKDFHAIIKRLSDITSNSGDLYRLCFNSRLSFCGHMSSNNENDESFSRTSETDNNDTCDVQSNGCTDCEMHDAPSLEDGAKCTKRSSHGQQCGELLSLLSSFMVKAKEDPNMINQSTLGGSLVTQLSSLLQTLEGAKNNGNESVSSCQQCSSDSLERKPELASPDYDCTRKQPANLLNQGNDDQPIQQIKTNDLLSQDDIGDGEGHGKQPSYSSQMDELETKQVTTNLNKDSGISNQSTLKGLLQTENKLPSPLIDAENSKPTQASSSVLTSFATTNSKPDLQNSATSKHLLTDQDEKPLLHKEGEIMPPTSLEPFVTATMIDRPNSTMQCSLDKQEECSSLINHTEDGDAISGLNIITDKSPISSLTDTGDVVTNGRRAVKPYSWDYGDIWEEELERAKSSESFESCGKAGYLPSRKYTDMMPSFEEIRDDLFQNAGFINDNGGRYDASKRRSRSADARSNLQDGSVWPDYRSAHDDPHSPFVRTIHQDESRPSTGLTRSWSSHHIGGNSVTVNVDWSRGRQMRVITGSVDRGFDDVHAQIIKEAVVKTSTFRGPKPWSVLKRKPSGLRRRSARSESFRSNNSDESRGKIDNDSESSDSPYISATSSDCLTMTTDDSSSVTSSQYYAASSLPSSPSVSNRSSACFSDTSTSDASDMRRVVYQRPPSEPSSRERYNWRCDVPLTRGMTLDQRFGFIERHNRVLLNEGKDCKVPLPGADDFYNKNSRNIQGQSSTLPRKWQGERLVSPLFVRSDPDLNRLTKVKFVGDSYSRSRISKNVRYTRNRSQSPSALGPPSTHTRVVSCEIVQSDDKKRDVYTRVNISESLKDEEAMKIHVGRNSKLGYPSTRQSWHGQSPTRVPSRHSQNNRKMSPDASFRHSFSSRTRQQPHQMIQSQRVLHVENPVHAKLVAVNTHENRMRGHWSTGSLRMSPSGRPRFLSDTVVMNNRHCEYPSMNNNDVHENFQNNSNGNSRRNIVEREQRTDLRTGTDRRRSPPDYLTAIKHSQGLRRQGNGAYFPATEKRFPNKDERFSTGRHSPTERNRFHAKPKGLVSHIVKETSFVGPSIFTKYQASPNPQTPRPRRSRSLNEKDTMSRRRLHNSEVYRRREIDNNDSDGKNLNDHPRSDLNAEAVHRPGRRRRYSEGAAGRATKHEVSSSDGIVGVSYCDPRRESVREGAYSIVKAESARDGAKSNDSPSTSKMKGRGQIPPTIDGNGGKTALQNKCGTKMPRTQPSKTAPQQKKNNRTSSSNSPLHVNDENVRDYTHSRFTQKPIENSETWRKLVALNQLRTDSVGSTPLHQTAMNCEVKGIVAETEFVDKYPGHQERYPQCNNEPVRHIISNENPEINSGEENNSSNFKERLAFNNASENKWTGLPLSTHVKNDKTKAVPDVAGEIIFATELHRDKIETDAGRHKEYQTNNTFSHEEEFPSKKVDEINGLAQDELIAEKRTFIPANRIPSFVKSNSNTSDFNEKVPIRGKEECNIIHSPILPNRQAHDNSNEVNVFIDYRSKRPVSVEYSEEDVSFLQTLGSSARSARRDKQDRSVERRVKAGRKNTSCSVLDGGVSNHPELIITNEEDVGHSRLSRKDRHEREMLTNGVNGVKNLQIEQYQNIKDSVHQPSPEPYRRDSTIIYTDARTSFGSDTDSVSRDSTVSSSGSDRTAILQEEMDISVDDLRQLTESGSKIGIDITAIHVGDSNEHLDATDSLPDELPPAMELSKTFEHYQKRMPADTRRNTELVVINEATNSNENGTTERTSKNNTLKRLIDAQNNESLSADNLLSSGYHMQSSCSSIASSRASTKSTGTDSSKGKNSSKNGGKGFLSKLKGFRNSFRKKSDSISFEKKGKINESESIYDENEEIARRFPSSTDANANVLATPRNRTKSETGHVQGTQVIARRSYDAFRHPNNNLRNVVGVKSVSSDHLNAYRINNTANINAIAARSLDVLAETCI